MGRGQHHPWAHPVPRAHVPATTRAAGGVELHHPRYVHTHHRRSNAAQTCRPSPVTPGRPRRRACNATEDKRLAVFVDRGQHQGHLCIASRNHRADPPASTTKKPTFVSGPAIARGQHGELRGYRTHRELQSRLPLRVRRMQLFPQSRYVLGQRHRPGPVSHCRPPPPRMQVLAFTTECPRRATAQGSRPDTLTDEANSPTLLSSCGCSGVSAILSPRGTMLRRQGGVMPDGAAPGGPNVVLGFDAAWGFALADQTSPALAGAAEALIDTTHDGAAGHRVAHSRRVRGQTARRCWSIRRRCRLPGTRWPVSSGGGARTARVGPVFRGSWRPIRGAGSPRRRWRRRRGCCWRHS